MNKVDSFNTKWYQNYRPYLVEMLGVDLFCGTGQVAALICHRHIIHSRSRSTPNIEKKKQPLKTSGCFFLEEVGGVEQVSDGLKKRQEIVVNCEIGIKIHGKFCLIYRLKNDRKLLLNSVSQKNLKKFYQSSTIADVRWVYRNSTLRERNKRSETYRFYVPGTVSSSLTYSIRSPG